MSDSLTADMVKLTDLLEKVDSGGLALPEFQRDYDWEDADVKALVATILSGWPAGSLLLHQDSEKVFRRRQFFGGPSKGIGSDTLVLDGQQRLTSLYHALYNTGDKRYALVVEHLQAGADDIEDWVNSYTPEEWTERYGTPLRQADAGLVPVSVLRSASDFFEWRDDVLDDTKKELLFEQRRMLTKLFRKLLHHVPDYRFPVITLKAEIPPAAVASIFERVNRTGKTLNAFDLMVAKVYEPNWNLRERWSSAVIESTILEEYCVDDGLPVLQVISLVFSEDLRKSAVLRLRREQVYENWDGAVESLAAALKFLKTKCGVVRVDWLPYRNMVIPIAALHFVWGHLEHEKQLIRWFWSRSFGLAFDVAANTRLVSEYRELKAGRFDESASISRVFDDDVVLATKRSHRALWSAFHCAIAQSLRSDGRTDSEFTVWRSVSLMDKDPTDARKPHLLVLSQGLLPSRLAREYVKLGSEVALENPEILAHLRPQMFGESVPTPVGVEQVLKARLTALSTFIYRETGLELQLGENWDQGTAADA